VHRGEVWREERPGYFTQQWWVNPTMASQANCTVDDPGAFWPYYPNVVYPGKLHANYYYKHRYRDGPIFEDITWHRWIVFSEAAYCTQPTYENRLCDYP